ncbi:MAG TPA: CvpA family protein [Candidatus Limnocylindrales bacterium]|nr:CvpA family protein [Candidatus Limnocylindrales bacterium]
MDFVATLQSINVVDLLVILFLFGMFVLGYIQGTVRRLLGIASIVFSFFLAMQINAAILGDFLARNWQQYPPEYSVMIGYLVLFVAGVVASTLVIQGTYRKTEIFAKYPVLDEILGGILGVVQGGLLLMFIVIILDQYFLYTNLPKDADELPFLRDFWNAINTSQTGMILHQTVIPNFLNLVSFLIPDDVMALYGLT